MTTRARAVRRGWQAPPEAQNLNWDSSMMDAKAFAADLSFKLLILSTPSF